jgi:hypothetical protein
MSLYNKSKWDYFVSSNYNQIIQLDKFKNCHNGDNILDTAKLQPYDINKLINLFSNNLKIYEINKLKTYHVLKSKNKIDVHQYNNIKNKTNLNYSKYDFFELFWKDNNENTRNGAMSMTSCDNVSKESRTSYSNPTNDLNDESNIGNIAINPAYFGEQINDFGRIVKFKNSHKLRILYCNPTNKLGRYFFRKAITKILLGEDYTFNLRDGCYKDGCLGQEIIYYFLEIYNYDRYYNLQMLFNNLKNNNEYELHINLPDKYTFEEFYNDESVNIYYPSLDGLYYHDDSSMKVDGTEISVHGTEIVTFIPEKLFDISSSIFINNIINSTELVKPTEYTFQDDAFHKYIYDNIGNYNSLTISIDNLKKINTFINNKCLL